MRLFGRQLVRKYKSLCLVDLSTTIYDNDCTLYIYNSCICVANTCLISTCILVTNLFFFI